MQGVCYMFASNSYTGMIKKIYTLFVLLLLSLGAFSQTNYEKFKKFFKSNDTAKIQLLLTEWEKVNPDDPELYTCAFNYYFSASKKEIISLERENPGKKDALQFTDSTGDVAGYMFANTSFHPEKLKLAFKYIDTGISKFPDRLDIRFGKCYVLGIIEDYENFKKEIIKTIDYSAINKNKWRWTENRQLDDAENFMLNAIQDYLRQLYETENDSLLPDMIQIGEESIKYYPDKIEILSTTAVALLLREEFDRALIYLLRAEKLNPTDFIVLNNIAQAYKLKGDRTNAIKYYELTEKYGDDEAKQKAKKNIMELKK